MVSKSQLRCGKFRWNIALFVEIEGATQALQHWTRKQDCTTDHQDVQPDQDHDAHQQPPIELLRTCGNQHVAGAMTMAVSSLPQGGSWKGARRTVRV